MLSDRTEVARTNDTSADLATQAVALPTSRVHLIGLFGSTDAPRALLRTADGDTLTVSIGDPVEKGTVVAIDAEKVIVAAANHTTVLRMPTPRGDTVTA